VTLNSSVVGDCVLKLEIQLNNTTNPVATSQKIQRTSVEYQPSNSVTEITLLSLRMISLRRYSSALGRLIVEVRGSHTIRHSHTLGRTPLNEWSVRRRGRYLHNTQQTQETNILTLSGIRTRNPSKRAALGYCYTVVTTNTTQQTDICMDKPRQTRVVTENPTCLFRLLPIKGLIILSLLTAGEVDIIRERVWWWMRPAFVDG
jgi:hypothetical protein